MINVVCEVPVYEESGKASRYDPPYVESKNSKVTVESANGVDGGLYHGVYLQVEVDGDALQVYVNGDDLRSAIEKCYACVHRYGRYTMLDHNEEVEVNR